MHAFIVTDTDEIDNLLKEHRAQRIEFSLKKIADIGELKSFTKIKQDTKTAVIIPNIDEASEETQNAFLKSLEEPQENIIYILTTNSLSNILPTIVSRCIVIESHKSQVVSEEVIKFAKEFTQMSVGKKFEKISEVKDRVEAVEFLTNLVSGGHQLFLKDASLINLLEEANKTLSAIKQNGNVQLQLTNFVINLT